MFKGKTIILGITGSIAAYKTTLLVRHFVKSGANVKVVMTRAATQFVTPLTFQVLSGKPVLSSLFSQDFPSDIPHISLAEEADIILVAPASANILAKAAAGIADDALSTLLLSARSPIIFVPAMNEKMYLNSQTQENIRTLKKRGYLFIEPEKGALACEEKGLGRLVQVSKIVDFVSRKFAKDLDFYGKKIMVTAGATQEPLDSVRFISNRSSGKMGYVFSQELKLRGAEVILISGPTFLQEPPGISLVRVETAQEMRETVLKNYSQVDAVIMTAAVADFKSLEVSEEKIPKRDYVEIKLAPNPDILKELGSKKRKQVLVGFTASSRNLIKTAKQKLFDKNLDLMVATDILAKNSGFGKDKAKLYLIDNQGKVDDLGLIEKSKAANLIADKVRSLLA